MTEEAKKLRNEYLRSWRARNKDKVKAAQQRYWEKRLMNSVQKGCN